MLNINAIITALLANRIRVSDHADEEAQADHLTFDSIYFSVLYGEIIEMYPDDTPYPSCLIYGEAFNGDPIHSIWAYNQQNQWTVLVTVYRPDPARWINWRERRPQA
jgi:hypothetical protein